jgi:hypothetical protein
MAVESHQARRPFASRRSLLTGTATGLLAGAGAMAAGGVLARPQAASAATTSTTTSTAATATVTPDWINIAAAPYNADPTGSSDSAAAVQAALSQVAANGGGVIYVPTGNFKLISALTYDSSAPLMITGDGPQASNFRMASTSTSITYLTITQTGDFVGGDLGTQGTVIIDKVAFYNDQESVSYADTNVAITLNSVNFGQIQNIAIYEGSESQRFNQGIVLNACNQVDVDNANIFTGVNGIAVTGYSQVNNIANTSVWSDTTGEPNAAAILYMGQILTANMESVICHDGDRGIYFTKDSDGNVPHLLFAYNVQPNNHAVADMEIDYGAQVYLTECFFSGATSIVDNPVPGILFGTDFQGSGKVEGCQFNGIAGHTISVQGGKGFLISGCEIGGNATYKYAANTYDEISIGASVSEVTIDTCHFNVDTLSGIGTGNPPRSAVHVEPGATAITVSNSKGAGTGYGSGAIVDGGNVVMRSGNIGLGLADQTTGGGSTVTGTSPADLSASITVPANDMTTGTIYRFTAFGHGTQASGTAVSIEPKINVGGSSLGTFTPASGPAAGAAFNWSYTCYLAVTATGATGTIVSNETFTWAGLTTSHGNNSFTVATTEANAVVMTASWSSATGSPTITCDGTMLERVQNYPAS